MASLALRKEEIRVEKENSQPYLGERECGWMSLSERERVRSTKQQNSFSCFQAGKEEF
jgi:hypothetical protein